MMPDPHIELWLYESEIRLAIGALGELERKIKAYGCFAGLTNETRGLPGTDRVRELKDKLTDIVERK